ncbi:MAG: hypothetical protein CVT66_07970 [Actinobacteria bacterium HGW-Actinobacteria-6]|jgi:hypothetical protein|nr:MAG: hypothetical protein CVT66_07970 [Actinobacteria bacterium HGW-Actinobacteria-6]
MPGCQSCGEEHAEGSGFCPKCGAGVVAETAPAAWLADPTGRHELRYWDSREWTNHVSDAGVASLEAEPQAAVQPQSVEVVPTIRISRVQRLLIVAVVVIVAVLALSLGGLSVWRNGTPGNSLSSDEKLMRRAPRDGTTAVLDIVYDNEASGFSGNYVFYDADHSSRRYELWPDEVGMVVVDGEESVDPLYFYETIQGPEPLSGTVQFTRDGVSAMTVSTGEQ